MHVRGPVVPMLARSADRLPTPSRGRAYLYEPKWDGFRALGVIDPSGRTALFSRRGTSLGEAWPELVGALYAELPPSTAVDGEIVRWTAAGRLDFDALQRRYQRRRRARQLAEVEPCHLVVFDVLEHEGEDLRARPLSVRRVVLERLFARIPAASPLALGLQTDDYDTAVGWLDELGAAGVEGVVAKPASSPYRSGERGWTKVKAFRTTEAIVGGVTGTLSRPRDLVLGLYDSTTGQLRMVGRTTDLDDQAAAQLAPLLTPAGDDHPWPAELPPSWGAARRHPVAYIRVEPTAVVEFRADPATSAAGWRHRQRVLRVRPDRTPDDVPHDLDLE